MTWTAHGEGFARRKAETAVKEIQAIGKLFVFSNRLGCAGSLLVTAAFGTVVLANARVQRSAKRLLTLRRRRGEPPPQPRRSDFLRLLMAGGMVQLHFPFGQGIRAGPTPLPSNDRNRHRCRFHGNARVGLCLHEHNVQLATATMWCRWTGFCFLRISTSSDALTAICFGKFQKPQTAPQVQF